MRQAGELVCFLRGISIGTEAGIGEGIHYGSYYDYRLIIGIAHNIIQFLILSVVKKTQQQQQKHIYIYKTPSQIPNSSKNRKLFVVLGF